MTADGSIERYADFGVAPGVRTPQTWQVPRATFDHLLLRHAASNGADVREQHRVLDVAFDEHGVTATVQGGEAGSSPYTVRAQAMIDASGRSGLLSRKFGLRIDEPRLANLAVFSHYSGVPRQEGRRAGDIRIVARHDLGWFWLIPISGELMSVGVVLPRAAAHGLKEIEPGMLLDRMIADTPAVADLLASARREWPVRVEKDFSFSVAGVCRRPLGARGRRRIVSRSGVLDRRRDRARVRSRGRAGGGRRTGGGRSLGATVRPFARRQRQRYRSFRRFVLGFYTAEFRDLVLRRRIRRLGCSARL